MSENTQNEFEQTPPTSADEEAQSIDLTSPQSASSSLAVEQETTGVASGETTLPPEAQGETNGGPLGCCLGVMVGLLLSLSLAILSRVYADPLGQLFQSNYGLLGLIIRILMGILACALAILCGYFGWKLGKRFYREYEPPVVKKRKNRSTSKKLRQGA